MQFDLLHCEGIAQSDGAEVVEGTELLPLSGLERKGMGKRRVNKEVIVQPDLIPFICLTCTTFRNPRKPRDTLALFPKSQSFLRPLDREIAGREKKPP